MAQLRITGKDRVKFLENLVVADLQSLKPNHATLSVFTNEKGGIIDDTIITNKGDHFYVVVNAGCADKDIAHLAKQQKDFSSKGGDVDFIRLDRSLIALQGPSSESILSKFVNDDISKMPFMTSKEMNINGIKGCYVSRCGYTGEDGFEISVEHGHAIQLAKTLLSYKDELKPAGLGARDTLRLEAGLCLYGHDLNEDITPVEASLLWVIGKRRREQGGFLGSEKILGQINGTLPVLKKRVGFITQGPPAREGVTIHDKETNKEIGKITSGTLSPVLKKNISMGYIDTKYSKINTTINVKIRDKLYSGEVVKMPFVPTNYKKLD
jgi:aminomethyltransferase